MRISVPDLADEHLQIARQASSGRSGHKLYGGREHQMHLTMIALTAGRMLDEHNNPGEALVQVVSGHVVVEGAGQRLEGSAGDLLVVPDAPHSLEALEESVIVLMTVNT
ncbi:cupin domain-containing protein [Aeromicrobium sp. CF3.5]|uniref:cupin domain-containing protein n=1 Tax=Aeromicrobium sp. CF3.5 TaxID=3373078 RepID=UPI003EE430A8